MSSALEWYIWVLSRKCHLNKTTRSPLGDILEGPSISLSYHGACQGVWHVCTDTHIMLPSVRMSPSFPWSCCITDVQEGHGISLGRGSIYPEGAASSYAWDFIPSTPMREPCVLFFYISLFFLFLLWLKMCHLWWDFYQARHVCKERISIEKCLHPVAILRGIFWYKVDLHCPSHYGWGQPSPGHSRVNYKAGWASQEVKQVRNISLEPLPQCLPGLAPVIDCEV